MTEARKMELLTGMVGDTDTATLTAYLEIAADVVLRHAYPFEPDRGEIPEAYDMVQVQIAAYLLNKRGAEGEVSHSENGISRHYEDGDIPPSLLRRIVPSAGVV